MKLVPFEKIANLNEIKKISMDQLGSKKIGKFGFGFYKRTKLLGYTILKKGDQPKSVKVDWIYAIADYGSKFIKKLEKKLSQKYDLILLNVCIDPNELESTVIRRINFYIKNNYRVYDIVYRKKYGPLLKMKKIIKN